MSAPDLPRSTRPAPLADESWFGAFGPTSDTTSLNEESNFSPSWHIGRPQAVRARRPPREVASTTFERIYRAFIAARAALGVALVATRWWAACSACARRSRSSP
jgi:two-component system sensor histidine kinase PilS (NtrC family)